ncbi:hypothetical protein BH11BAC5_BH11BAC5_54610 [soil metagenome]
MIIDSGRNDYYHERNATEIMYQVQKSKNSISGKVHWISK